MELSIAAPLMRIAPRRPPRRVLVALLCAALALAILAGGWLWFRSSSLAAVRDVQVSGMSGPQRTQIEAALRSAARGMSTLAPDTGALRAAVARYPVVRSLSAYPSFPHGLRIVVVEQLPVAALADGGARTAVAADGVVLGGALAARALPTIAVGGEPAPGSTVHTNAVRAALLVMGAAPRELARHVASLSTGAQGLTLAMRNGLLVYFGDASAARAKWSALEHVLADASSQGASYVDVRVPWRPAAGFPGGAGPPTQTTGAASPQAGAAQGLDGSAATVEAIAEELRSPSGTPSTTAAPTEAAAGAPPTGTGAAGAPAGGVPAAGSQAPGGETGGAAASGPQAAPGETAGTLAGGSGSAGAAGAQGAGGVQAGGG